MKAFFIIFIFCFSLCSCNSESSKDQIPGITDSAKNISIPEKNITENKPVNLSLHLTSLEIVDSTSGDIYTKFGISTAGKCYDCNLADLSVNDGKITFTNICDSKNNITFDILKIETTGKQIQVYIQNGSLTFEKFENAPVYRLKIDGELKLNKDLKLIEYYTPETEVLKFKTHDCGDFQG